MNKCLILSKNTYETKLALLEDSKLDEIYIEREKEKEISGNIYKGKIVDILNKGEIIFVDIGLEKNAFLSFENKKNIPKFNISDSLIVQVETEARDEKGARLTLDYSINGENLVLLPNSKNLSISKKIEDLEVIKKLKDTFLNIDKGLILRTKSVEKSPETLLEEYKKLEAIDNQIKKDFKEKNTTLLYDNNSILKKALTLLDEDIDEFIIDDEDSFNRIKNTLEENKKNYLLKKLKKYFKDEDIFSYYKIDTQIERALDRKVYLESGASIVIEKTEALVSIDVNTGQNIGNQSSQNFIFNTNLEACKEIARQIKLRNLAGIIIIDFIDLKKISDRKKILEELKRYLKKDKMEINSLDFSHLGLVQFTRKRQGKELSFYYREKCYYCEGTSYLLSKDRIILNLLAELNSQIKCNDLNKIVVKTKKDIIKEVKKLISNTKIEYVEDNSFYKEGYKIELYRR
ncbi:ribonuclease E/G [Fusobacterium pseudoperiodonticum]|uniref:ribonuclease E/G n=1 Tax=Fusobacterium pseudoperiodonticum TaxID=2663009 RepID=UPI0030CC6982